MVRSQNFLTLASRPIGETHGPYRLPCPVAALRLWGRAARRRRAVELGPRPYFLIDQCGRGP
jgi:hypothetical protein